MAENAVSTRPDGSPENHNENGQVSQENQGDGGANPPEPPGRSYFDITKGFIMRAMFMYFVASFFRKPAAPETNPNAPARLPAFNYFENSSLIDMYVYLSDNEILKEPNEKFLLWEKKGLIYGDWYSGENGDGSFTFETTIEATHALKSNGSIFLHTYFVKRDSSSKSKNPISGIYAYSSKRLNKYKKMRFTKTQNLLTGETALTEEQIAEAEKNNQAIVSHWHPNITVNLVTDQTNWVQGTVPSPLNEYIEFSLNGDYYKPIVFYNEFWNLMRDYEPLNDTIKTLELRITYQPLSLFKWQMYAAHLMKSKFTANVFQDEMEDEDQDSLKEALLETSPYLLGATILVSLLHSVFELLAFKNDIQFWNNRKSFEGLSIRSVFYGVFQSFIVLLYVLDNDTNTLIKISCGIGLCIDAWKINKVVDIKLDRERKFLKIFPRLVFKDKGSYVESSTKEYDQLAFKYLSWVLFPLLACYAVYSVVYLHHKGWYSWMLNMIYGFLLTFGFIMMTPQLFINYKLKSVAHLPWRMMSYKCLNTFIDDIFAFVIKMPTMYRLGCFRDDIVFFIFLYQRWIYKTDPKRLNEFGFSGEMENEKVSDNVENSPQKTIEAKKED